MCKYENDLPLIERSGHISSVKVENKTLKVTIKPDEINTEITTLLSYSKRMKVHSGLDEALTMPWNIHFPVKQEKILCSVRK